MDLEVAYEKSIPSVLLSGVGFSDIGGRFASSMQALSMQVLGRKWQPKIHPALGWLQRLNKKWQEIRA